MASALKQSWVASVRLHVCRHATQPTLCDGLDPPLHDAAVSMNDTPVVFRSFVVPHGDTLSMWE
jgi:hypothetical protein